MILKWFSNRIEERKKAEKDREEKALADFKVQEKKVAKQVRAMHEAMMERPCAMREGFIKCTDACVHFQRGWVGHLPKSFEPGLIPYAKAPKCKLWK